MSHQDAAADRRPRNKKRPAPPSETIPAEASEWMSSAFQLDPELCAAPSEWLSLSSKQLKEIYQALRGVEHIGQKRKPLPARRQTKAALVEEMRSSFYVDEDCTVVDVAAMQALRLHGNSSGHPFGAAAAASAGGPNAPPFTPTRTPPKPKSPPKPPQRPSAASRAAPHAAAAAAASSAQATSVAPNFQQVDPWTSTATQPALGAAGPSPSFGRYATSNPGLGRTAAPSASSQPFSSGANATPFGGAATASGYGFGAAAVASPPTSVPQSRSGGYGSQRPSPSRVVARLPRASISPRMRFSAGPPRQVAAAKNPPANPAGGPPHGGPAAASQSPFPPAGAGGGSFPAPSSNPFQGSAFPGSNPFQDSAFGSSRGQPAPPSFTLISSQRTAAAQNPSSGGPFAPESRQNQVFVFGEDAGRQAPAAPLAASSNPIRQGPTAGSIQPSQAGARGGAAPPSAASVGRPQSGPAAPSAQSSSPDSAATDQNPETTPQNEEEAGLLSATLTMGFRDPAEVLISIRKLVAIRGQQVTSEMVMCDIVQTREEAEFARQMDQARLASERDRRTDAEARRKANALAHEEILLTASPAVWIESKDMFRGSWLLKSSCRDTLLSRVTEEPSELKRHLVEILKLEKKSRQWYGDELPSYYFDGVLADRLRVIKDCSKLEVALKREVVSLRDGLMLLSNQDSNAPLVFLEAKEEWKRRYGEGDDDDDDDVILLETRRPTQAAQRVETIETI